MINHEVLRVPVTALAFSKDYLFVGEGPILKIHRRHDNNLLSTFQVFPSQSIHGIAVHSDGIVVWGGRLVATYAFARADHSMLNHVSTHEAIDWILDVSISPKTPDTKRRASLITAHNALLLLHLDSPTLELEELTSNSRCILYSAHLYWMSDRHILVASGTVFGDIIVWSCMLQQDSLPSSVLHHVLMGHDGSIFGVQVVDRLGAQAHGGPSRLLASCSDDRTIRIWDISSLPETAANPQAAADLTSARETGFGANVADVLSDSLSGGRCIAKAWGHASRIWGVKFIVSERMDNLSYIVSFGEDATYQFWSLEETGPEEYSIFHLGGSGLHSGKNIWSWAVDHDATETAIIASGGADGSIALEPKSVPFTQESDHIQTWSIEDLGSCCPEQPSSGRKDKLRSYAFLDSRNLIVTTDAGNVFSLTTNQEEQAQIQWICTEPKLRGYSVVTSIPSLSVAFLAGMDGSVLLYTANKVTELVKSTGKTSALFAQHMPASNAAVQAVGLLVANVEAKTALFLIFGLKKTSEAVSKSKSMSQWQLSMPKGFVTTSFLIVSLGEAEQNILLVLGSRNGSIIVFSLSLAANDGKDTAVAHECLLQKAHGTDAVTDLAWVPESDTGNSKGHLFSVGRDGTYAIHRLSKSSAEINLDLINQTSLPLGNMIEGLHIDETTNHVLVWGFHSKRFIVFDATDELEIMTVECGGANRIWKFEPEGNLQGGHFAWTKASQLCRFSQTQQPRQILSKGSHGREIKAVAVAPQNPMESGILFATGAEDTDIKLFAYQTLDEMPHFRCVRTLRKHNTGIQQLEWSSDGRYLFSSGGFEEFFVWKVEAAPLVGLGVVCESLCPTESALPDLRIMGFSVKEDVAGFVITMVRSDSTLRVYRYRHGKEVDWHILMAGNYLTSCLTQCLHVQHQGLAEQLITAGTDGHIALFSLISDMSALTLSTSEPAALKWTARHKIHQNTIHCMKLHQLNGEACLLLTGGDDNAVAFTLCTWQSKVQNTPEISTLTVPRAHAAAVTGIEIIVSSSSNLLTIATSSIDQRVKIWEVEYNSQLPGVEGLAVKRKGNHFTAVADVSGIASLDSTAIIVCGVGMDVWRRSD